MRYGIWAAIMITGIGALCAPAEGATVEELQAQHQKATAACGKDLAELAKWCERKKLAGPAARFRSEALWCRPEDKKLRKAVGWVRKGLEWEWPTDARAKFRAAALDAPAAENQDLAKRVTKVRAKGTKRLLALAEAAKPPEAADGDVAVALDEIRVQALELALRLDGSNDDVRKAVGYVKHGDRLVHADAIEYLEARAESRERGAEVVEWEIEIREDTPENALPRAASDSLMVTASASLHLAKSAVTRATQVIRVLEDVYELPEEYRSHIARRDFVLVDSTDQRTNVMQQYHKRGLRPLVETADTTLSRFGDIGLLVLEDDDDEATAVACAGAARVGVATLFKVVFENAKDKPRKAEAWIQDAMTMDVLDRALGRVHPTLGIELRRGKSGDRRTGADWLARALTQFEHGDDPPMAQVAAAGPWKIGSDELAKGCAFLRFVFESEPDKATEFVYSALALGVEAAAQEVFGRALADMEVDYAEWLRISR